MKKILFFVMFKKTIHLNYKENKSSIANGTNKEVKKMKFDKSLQLFINYSVGLNRSNETIKTYTKELRYFFDFLTENGVEDIEKVKTVHLELYQGELLEKGNTANTRSKKNCVLRSYFKYLHSRELIEKNPTKILDPIKVKDSDMKKKDILTIAEANRLLRYTVKHSIPSLKERNKCLLYLMMFLGLRVSEVIHLKTEDFDFKNKTLHVREAKGGKYRAMPIFDSISKELKDYVKNRTVESEYFFTAKKSNKPLDSRSVHDMVKRYVALAGITKNIGCHSLRRMAATMQLAAGINVVHTKEFLGHSNIATTMAYMNPDKEEIKKGIRKHTMLNKKISKIKL